jgi:starch synthase (maltosyl-transferring)
MMASLGARSGSRILIEGIYPILEGGRFPLKRVAGEPIDVWADLICDGTALLAADLLWRLAGSTNWSRVGMRLRDNDRWTASFTPAEPGRYEYAIEAWIDRFGTWRRDTLVKRNAGLDISVELQEGLAIFATLKPRGPAEVARVAAARRRLEQSGKDDDLFSEQIAVAAATDRQTDLTSTPAFPLVVDRPIARAGAWYEMVPRSQSRDPGRHGTFDDAIARLPDIAGLGFDVVYLTPIHPIGRTNRKGRNNALLAGPDDPGSFYAIGSPEGGHDAVHPELGTLADFRRFVDACTAHGLEVALDFAVQCSPDHPWIAQHPDWFKWRPDGTIRYAENPPKKYEDIVNPDFYGPDGKQLWNALRDIVLFWIAQGVRIFRVDNPHTKPLPFWEWLIREVKTADPGVVFLAEAFTRPKVMKALAKLGFTQSYTYFTWRSGKEELQAYLSEITGYPEREYFRPNFFVNTPDILPFHLQGGEPWIFKSRVALAATLSGSYGIYNGLELIEHAPVPGKEEYLDSEKYEIKVRDWSKPGNIKDYIGQLNRLRRANTALRQTHNLRFAALDDADVIGFVKESPSRDEAVAVAIALSNPEARDFWFHLGDLGIGPEGSRGRVRAIENLLTGEETAIEWGGARRRIDPGHDPALLFRCVR